LLPVPGPDPARGRVTVACVDKEWHALPARLLAETLRLRGWQVGYLGAQVPTAHLVRQIHRTGSSVVCLSAALSTRLPIAHAAITAVQARSEEHTSELQSRENLVCRLLLEKKKKKNH